MSTREFVWSNVSLERPYELDTLLETLVHLASLTSRGPIVWEAYTSGGKIHYRLGTYRSSVAKVQEVFKAHVNTQFTDASARPSVTVAKRLKISHPVLSLNTDTTSAMIRATLAAMMTGPGTVLQVVLGAAHAPSTVPKDLPDPTISWIHSVIGNLPKATSEQHRRVREKAELPRFEAVVRIGSTGESGKAKLSSMVSAIRTLSSAGVSIRAEDEKPEHLDSAALPWRMPLLLSVKELAPFLLLPTGEEEFPGAPGLHPKLVLTPKWYKGPDDSDKDSRTFAKSLDAVPKNLSISAKSALTHSLLLGPTGSGKSTAMEHLILADIRAGRSVLVIDPKADLVTSILEKLPEERAGDVVVLDASDPCPVGFNPLSLGTDPTLTADAILSVFQEVFAASWGVRTQDVLSAALLTLAKTPGANLLWLPKLLTDDAFRDSVVRKLCDPVALEPFWEHFNSMRDSERRTEIAPVMNKLRQFQYRPALRNTLGQTNPKFNLRELFTSRKIVLVPLNRGLIGGESARLLGGLVVGLTWVLALSRANIAPEKRHFVSLFIDELQDYLALPSSFSDALAQARGLGVGFTVAHQYRGQLSPEIKAGIDSNTRNKICFGLQASDAKDMAAEAPNLDSEDFMSLPRYEVYTVFQSEGKSTGWISGKTLPPARPVRVAAELKALSMARYGTPAEQVERELISLYQPNDSVSPKVTDAPIGRKKIDRKEDQ